MLIPRMIRKTMRGEPLPVYGDGGHIRDWLYVRDHCRGLVLALLKGIPGEVYTIGGRCEMRNLDLVRTLIDVVHELVPSSAVRPASELITFVQDRPGHDRRYAIDCRKAEMELGWSPQENFETGLRKTVRWYLENEPWIEHIEDGSYRGERLGMLV